MNKKILIVEDESVVALDIKFILQKADYKIMGIALSALEALNQIEKEKPDMVILDITFHGKINGIELGEILTRKHIEFIYLSATPPQLIVEMAKKTQPAAIISKPFSAKELLDTLKVTLLKRTKGNGPRSSNGDAL